MKQGVFIGIVFFMLGCSNAVETPPQKQIEVVEDLFLKDIEEYPSFVQAIISCDTIGFRGVTSTITMSEVRGVETAVHEETDSLIVRFTIEDGIENNAELEYYFNPDSTFKYLEMTVFCTEKDTRDSVLSSLEQYYSARENLKPLESGFEFRKDNIQILVKKDGTDEFPNLLIAVSPIFPL